MPFFIAINFHNEAGISNQRDPNIIILKMSYFNNTCDPIFIDGIAGGIGAHNWTWAQNQPWCTYIASNEIYYIENLTINGGSTNSCIEIRNSNVNLIIRNCTLYNSTNSPNDAGLNLINVSNSQIIENNCTNNPYHGIRIYNSSDNRIYLNSLNDNYVRGLIISGSNNTEISNNTFINTPYPRDSVYGIDCTGNCFNLTISNNTIIGNQLEGIIINKLSNSTISNNKINNNGQRGISFSGDSIGNTIKNNKIYENAHEGIFLNTLSSNNNFTENEIYENGRDGMVLNSMSTLNNILDNEIYENGGYGLSLDFYCNDNKIIGNKINNNDDHGIILSDNSGNIIIRNEANDNAEFGIKLENSNNSIIFNNTASYVGLGNQQQSGIVVGQNSNNNTILHNTVASNFWQGIYLQNANFNNITANMLNNNSNDIVIYSSNNTIVIGNSVNARNFDIMKQILKII
ncbi:MAG: right-handed parallel beta-helix repeat-containing protein [Promethearchaeota archaeon]